MPDRSNLLAYAIRTDHGVERCYTKGFHPSILAVEFTLSEAMDAYRWHRLDRPDEGVTLTGYYRGPGPGNQPEVRDLTPKEKPYV